MGRRAIGGAVVDSALYAWRLRVALDLIRAGELTESRRMAYYFLRRRLRHRLPTRARPSLRLVAPRVRVADPMITIVIPHVNYSHFLPECLVSLVQQSYGSFTALVLESGSTESHRERAITAVHDLGDARFKIEVGPRRTLAENRNKGFAVAQTPLVMSLDPDDYLHPDYLRDVLTLLVAQDLDVATSSVKLFGSASGTWDAPPMMRARDFRFSNPIPSFALMRREVWSTVGGFQDVDFRGQTLHEDWLFWFHAAQLGFRFGSVPDELAFVRRHAEGMSQGDTMMRTHDQARLIRTIGPKLGTRAGKSRQRSQSEQRAVAWRDSSPILEPGLEGTSSDRTLVVHAPFLPRAGATKVVAAVTGEFVDRGWKVLLFTTEPEPKEHPGGAGLLPPGVEIRPLHGRVPKAMWNDFVNGHAAARNVVANWIVGSRWAYRRWQPEPGALVVDSQFVQGSEHYTSSTRHADKLSLVVCENQRLMDDYVARIESVASPPRVVYIPNGVETPAHVSDVADRRLISFVGRLAPEKNPAAFIRVAGRLSPVSSYSWVVVGDGPLGEATRRLADSVAPSVEFTGHVQEPSIYLANSRLLIVPSGALEGRPNVILEALAWGVPVVAYDVGGVSELVRSGVNGFLVNQGDEVALERAVYAVISDQALAERLSIGARETANANPWARTGEQYFVAIQQLLESEETSKL